MSLLAPTSTLLPPLTLKQAQQQLTLQFAAVATVAPNTDQGSAIQALLNTVALLFSQGQVSQTAMANVSRLATSFGSDVDSFVAPFGYTRLGAAASSGSVTFSLNSVSSQQIVIPIGTIVIASNGLQFTVVIDQTQTGYSAALNGYVIPVGQLSVSATVQCNSIGKIGNVKATQINALYGGAGTPKPAVDNVSNPQDFINGTDTETDAQLKARFTLGQSGGKDATSNALAAAILGVQNNLTYSIGDMMNITGSGSPPSTTTTGAVTIPAVNATVSVAVSNVNAIPFLGYVIVSDGAHAFYGQVTAIGTNITITCLYQITGAGTVASGATVLFVGGSGFFTAVVNQIGQSVGPTPALLAAVATALDKVRSAGCSRSIIGPTLINVNCVATLKLTASGVWTTVQPAAIAAFNNFVNYIGLDPAGNSTVCAYIDVGMILRQVPGVLRVDGLTLNGGTADLTATFAQQLVAGTCTLTQG